MSSESIQQLVSCMGQPVAGNPTQFMMERALADCGLDWRYLTLEVGPEDLPAAVAGMRAMGFRGGNFTIPHKVAVIEHLDGLSQAAELMQAVNCVHRDDGKLIGENTDGKGFVQFLRARRSSSSELAVPRERLPWNLGWPAPRRSILSIARRIVGWNWSNC